MACHCSERFHDRDEWHLGNKTAIGEIREEILGTSSMASADEYYGYVEQCIALAAKELHPGDRARLLQMAKSWRDLAEKLEASQNNPAATPASSGVRGTKQG